MKVLLLFPGIYSVANTFMYGLRACGCSPKVFDYQSYIYAGIKRVHQYASKTPYMLRSRINEFYLDKVNQIHRRIYDGFLPDIVIVYNSEMLRRDTVLYFKKRAKVIFFMGDSPFFTPVNDEYLPCLREADLILSPDTYWIEQLSILGIDTCRFFLPGSNPKDHSAGDGLAMSRKTTGLVFFGQPYTGAWGYKRAMFLNAFARCDLKIYTNATISRWYREFPALEKCVCHTGARINSKQHNEILNSAWLYPVDANPGLINGVHIRIIDCISSGVIPIVEYRKDVEQVFNGTGLPLLKCYSDAETVASELLQNPAMFHKVFVNLRDFVFDRYRPEITMYELLNWIDNA